VALALSTLSTEYVRVQISALKNGVISDPTSDPVQFAFPTRGTDPANWFSGSWETVFDSTTNTYTYYAKCLVGPDGGTTSLAVGHYDIWVKITDSPEVPVMFSGNLLIK